MMQRIKENGHDHKELPQPCPENRIAATHLGLIDGGGSWGRNFMEFMLSRTVADLCAAHGLCYALDLTPAGLCP